MGIRRGRHPGSSRGTEVPHRRRSAGRVVLWGCGAVVALLVLAFVAMMVGFVWVMGENHRKMFGG
ncbi:hypothetical protein G3I40_07705 [Streptomyces sp. SID14478]|uniref:hypothetical protein n=1 Tax=Streptomyces sp. SID14478 TaxID=2706073 RepID=UPI0013D90FCE|nr:hypothetical protein [Streptomyces sp. SID14478]NEB75114.1 hypothetical protein [Streptomyces sp. SID14478]